MHRGLWHHRTEVEAIETYQALVRSDPEITVRRLSNRMDCAFEKPAFCVPLLADVLGRLPIWIQRPRLVKQTRYRQPGHETSNRDQRPHHGKYSNFSITTSVSFFSGISPLLKTYRLMRTESPPAEGTPEVKTCRLTTRETFVSREPALA